MQKILDKILLSENVVQKFYDNYSNADFKKWITDILPEIEDCIEAKQDTPWHIYNCWEHILHSVENINKLDINFDYKTRRILAYTMLFHDIGKPSCHIRRFSKFFNKEVDSFPNHNKASQTIAKRTLKFFEFNQAEQELIELLIGEHDIFMNIKLTENGTPNQRLLTKELVEDYVQKYNKYGDGAQIMKYLVLIGKADNLAQNPDLTGNSLLLIDTMYKMIF